MIKFYYNLAPNPDKGGAVPGGDGTAVRTRPRRHAQGRTARHRRFLRINPNAKVPVDRRWRRDGVRQQRDPSVSGGEDRQVPAGQFARRARRIAVVADVRRFRHRPLFRARRCISATSRPSRRIMRSLATPSRRAPLGHPERPAGQASLSCWATRTRSSTWRCGAGRAWCRSCWARRRWRTMPNLKRHLDEISARPAAAQALGAEGQAQLQGGDGRRCATGDVPVPGGKDRLNAVGR